MQTDKRERERSCYKCGYKAVTEERACPQCRHGLETTTSVRIRGLLLVVCGAFLVPFVGYIALWMLGAMASTNPAGPQFTGTREEMLLILALVGLVIVVGFVALAMGLWQLTLGRRNKIFVRTVMVLAAALFGTGAYFVLAAK